MPSQQIIEDALVAVVENRYRARLGVPDDRHVFGRRDSLRADHERGKKSVQRFERHRRIGHLIAGQEIAEPVDLASAERDVGRRIVRRGLVRGHRASLDRQALRCQHSAAPGRLPAEKPGGTALSAARPSPGVR